MKWDSCKGVGGVKGRKKGRGEGQGVMSFTQPFQPLHIACPTFGIRTHISTPAPLHFSTLLQTCCGSSWFQDVFGRPLTAPPAHHAPDFELCPTLLTSPLFTLPHTCCGSSLKRHARMSSADSSPSQTHFSAPAIPTLFHTCCGSSLKRHARMSLANKITPQHKTYSPEFSMVPHASSPPHTHFSTLLHTCCGSSLKRHARMSSADSSPAAYAASRKRRWACTQVWT